MPEEHPTPKVRDRAAAGSKRSLFGERSTIEPRHLYKAVGLLFVLAIVFRFFSEVTQVFLLLYASSIVAVGLNPIVRKLPLERGWTAVGIALVAFSVIGFLLWLCARLIVSQARSFIEGLPELEERFVGWWEAFLARTGFNPEWFGDEPLQELANFLADFLGTHLLGHAAGILAAIFVPFIILIGGIYALARPNKSLLEPLMRVVPKDRRPAYYRILDLLGERLFGWLRGTLLAMFGVGVLSTIGFLVLGVEYAILLGVFMGLMEFIPIVGPWIGGAPAVLIAFLDEPTKGLLVLILLLAVQQIESQIITPWAMSSQANVHPVITLFALILFGSLFGFLGILLAVPLVLLIGTVVEVLWIEYTINADADYIPPVADE